MRCVWVGVNHYLFFAPTTRPRQAEAERPLCNIIKHSHTQFYLKLMAYLRWVGRELDFMNLSKKKTREVPLKKTKPEKKINSHIEFGLIWGLNPGPRTIYFFFFLGKERRRKPKARIIPLDQSTLVSYFRDALFEYLMQSGR